MYSGNDWHLKDTITCIHQNGRHTKGEGVGLGGKELGRGG